jgi:HK97 family phage major capsid protein
MRTNRELREQRRDVYRQINALDLTGKNAADVKKFEQLDREFRMLSNELDFVEEGAMGEFRGGLSHGGFSGNGKVDDSEHRRAFGAYLRRGAADLNEQDRRTLFEKRDMGTNGQGAYPGAAGSSGGFFVPVGFVDRVENAMKYVGPMLDGGTGLPTIMPTETGQPLPYPAADDTSNVGEQVGEGQQVTTQDVSLQQVVFGAYKYSTKLVKVSIELLQDSAFDLEGFLINEFAQRLARILNQKFTTGSGTNEPLGLMTAIVNGGNLVSAVGSASNDGSSASTNTIGTDDLTELEHAVDPIYRPGSVYMFHDSTLKAVKKLKDKYGDPLFRESMRDGQPATIGGYRYCVNQYMDTLQTQSSSPAVTRRTVAFGQLSKYIVRRVREMSVLRLTERFADFGQVAFIGFARYDGNSIDIGHRALAALQNTY